MEYCNEVRNPYIKHTGESATNSYLKHTGESAKNDYLKHTGETAKNSYHGDFDYTDLSCEVHVRLKKFGLITLGRLRSSGESNEAYQIINRKETMN